MKLLLDFGHGGGEYGGNSFNGTAEKDINLKVGALLYERLCKDIEIILTRNNDIFVSLENRSNLVNTVNADLNISIHHNNFDGYKIGGEIYVSKFNNTPDFAHILKQDFNNAKIKSWVNKDGKDYLHMIRETKYPLYIVEFAYIDNKNDLNMDSYSNVLKEVNCLEKAIREFFGIEQKQILRDSLKELEKEICLNRRRIARLQRSLQRLK